MVYNCIEHFLQTAETNIKHQLSIATSKNSSEVNTECINSLKANVATDEGKDRNEM